MLNLVHLDDAARRNVDEIRCRRVPRPFRRQRVRVSAERGVQSRKSVDDVAGAVLPNDFGGMTATGQPGERAAQLHGEASSIPGV